MTEPATDAARGRAKWVSHGMSNRLIYLGTIRGCTYLPKPLLYGISRVGNAIALAAMRETLAAVTENYRLGFGWSDDAARAAGRELFYSYGRTTIDLFRTRGGGLERLPPLAEHARDEAVLDSVLRPNRGCLIVTGHVGNWELGAISLVARGKKIAVVGQPELDPTVHALRLETRDKFGVETIDIGATMATAFRVRDAIARGLIVAMVADRAYAQDNVSVRYFGRELPFLSSPARLARFADCPLVPCYLLRSPDGSYRSHFAEPLEADRSLAPEADARRMMSAVAAVVESAIRAEPTQWFNFYRYFTTPLKAA